jgi:NAD(P)-dependent dehydrogenase (short-subunit alcohol dehydrogenase family)
LGLGSFTRIARIDSRSEENKEDPMKIAIVTGGGNGIGKATALELGRCGVSVILTYHSDKKALRLSLEKLNRTKRSGP